MSVVVGKRGLLNPAEKIIGYMEGRAIQIANLEVQHKEILMGHILHQTPLLSLTFASLSSLIPQPRSVSMFALLLCFSSGPPQMRHLESQRVVPGPGITPGSNIATSFLHPGHSFPVPRGVSVLCSRLVATAESVRAEIGQGRVDTTGLLGGTEGTKGTDALGWCA